MPMQGGMHEMTAKVVMARLPAVAILAALLLVAALGVPYLIRHRIRSNEAAALVSLRKIIALSNAYIERTQTVDSVCGRFSPNARNDRLEQAQVRAVFEDALKHDYQLELSNCSQVGYRIVANPIHSGPIAPYRFCSDQTGVIHFAESSSKCEESTPSGSIDDRRN
jgi:hypothetical protein